MNDELLTVKEYAARFKLHVQTVYTAIRYQRLEHEVERPLKGKGRAIRIRVPRELSSSQRPPTAA